MASSSDGGARRPDIVGQEGALGGHPGQGVQLAIDGLKPQRRHPDVVGRRVAERERQVALLEQGAALGAQALVAQLSELHHRPAIYGESGRDAGIQRRFSAVALGSRG